MKTIAILSQKGGTGKTTIAVNLAVAAELKKLSTVIIDLDSQASATAWGDNRELETPFVISAQAARIHHLLKTAKDNNAALVIIDTAPHSENAALEAARAADIILIPCKPSIIDLRAVGSTVDTALIAKKPAYIVLNQAPARSSLLDEAKDAVSELEAKLIPVQLVSRISHVKAFTHSLGVLEYEPKGKAAEEIKKLFLYLNKILKGLENDKK